EQQREPSAWPRHPGELREAAPEIALPGCDGLRRRARRAARPHLRTAELPLVEAQPAQPQPMVLEVVVHAGIGRRAQDEIHRALAHEREAARIRDLDTSGGRVPRAAPLCLEQPLAELARLLHEEADREAARDALRGGGAARVTAADAHLREQRGEHETQRAGDLALGNAVDPVAQSVELEEHVRGEELAIFRTVRM